MGPLRRDFPLTRPVFLDNTGSNPCLEYQLQVSLFFYEVETRGVLPLRIHSLPKESFSNGK